MMLTQHEKIMIYLMTLAVNQPARVQDVERRIPELFPSNSYGELGSGEIREIHQMARDTNLVISVRRGSYCLSQAGVRLLRHQDIGRKLDNRRLFLIKAERKALK